MVGAFDETSNIRLEADLWTRSLRSLVAPSQPDTFGHY
jgi:hypothetical protein